MSDSTRRDAGPTIGEAHAKCWRKCHANYGDCGCRLGNATLVDAYRIAVINDYGADATRQSNAKKVMLSEALMARCAALSAEAPATPHSEPTTLPDIPIPVTDEERIQWLRDTADACEGEPNSDANILNAIADRLSKLVARLDVRSDRFDRALTIEPEPTPQEKPE